MAALARAGAAAGLVLPLAAPVDSFASYCNNRACDECNGALLWPVFLLPFFFALGLLGQSDWVLLLGDVQTLPPMTEWLNKPALQ